MNLPKDLALCVRFARFCAEYAVEPADLAELVQLARKVYSAGERWCNTGAPSDKAEKRFADKAAALGFEVGSAGLFPSLKRGGQWIELPK